MGIPKGLHPQIAQLGRIKIGWLGAEQKSSRGKQFRPPKKLDYFLITTNDRDASGSLIVDDEAMSELKAGGFASPDGKLRRVPIALLSDDPGEVFTAQWARYDGKRRTDSCDGEEHITYYRGEAKLEQPLSNDCDGREHLVAGWKLHALFRCVLACGAARFGGFYTFRTTSKISVEQLWGGLLHISQLTGGVLAGIPLQLVVRPIQVTPEGRPTTVYCVHLELRATDLGAVQEQALRVARYRAEHASQIRAAQAQYTACLQLPAGPDEDDDEQAEVAQEYHPEAAASEPPAADPWAAAVKTAEAPVLEPPPEDPASWGEVVEEREPGEDAEPYGGEVTDDPRR